MMLREQDGFWEGSGFGMVGLENFVFLVVSGILA